MGCEGKHLVFHVVQVQFPATPSMKSLLLLCFAVVFVGCAAPASNMNRLSVGMTKADVLQVMGQPQTVSAQAGVETLVYRLGEGLKTTRLPGSGPSTGQATGLYVVRLESGKVVAFGRAGD